jgi:cytochrome c-type biogenesis protein CcmF
MICFVAAASLLLVFRRVPLLRSKTKLESLASREATFLYNNLLLVALCLTILWGVLFPILSEAVRGESVTVGRPYYDFFLRAFGLPLLLLMGIGPLVAWRRASLRSLGKTFLWPFAAAVVGGIGLLAAGAGSSTPGLIAYTFSIFVGATIVLEFARGTAARRALAGGSVPRAFADLVSRNRRRYGGYIVHAAIVLLAIGIAGSSAYDTSRSARLARGESLKVRDYTLVYRGLTSSRSQNAIEQRATIDVYRGGDRIAIMHPGKNDYPVEQQVSNEVSIRSDWLTGEDLFLITEQINGNGTIDFKAIINPLVNLIWLSGFVFLLGSLVALWPDVREEQRLAVRYGQLPQEA